jgi:hypothetical protein
MIKCPHIFTKERLLDIYNKKYNYQCLLCGKNKTIIEDSFKYFELKQKDQLI